MKKVFSVYDKFANWLCSFTADKYVHLVVGLLIGFFVSLIFAVTTKNGVPLSYAFCGVVAAFLIMLFKEMVDFFRGEPFDAKDLLFGTVGGVLGALLWLI